MGFACERTAVAWRAPRASTGCARRALAVAVLAVTAVAVLGAAPVGATVRAKYSASDCDAVLGISDEIPDVQGSGANYDRRQVAAAATGFKETAKKVDDKKLKAALVVLGNVYAEMAKARTAAGAILATGKAGKKYAKAIGVWSTAVLECATAGLTVPSLPNNVTIPSLPR